MRNPNERRPWHHLTARQRSLLLRLASDGPLLALKPWEMATIRSLKDRGLVRTKNPKKDGADHPGLWFMTGEARRLIQALTRDGRRKPGASTAPAVENSEPAPCDDGPVEQG